MSKRYREPVTDVVTPAGMAAAGQSAAGQDSATTVAATATGSAVATLVRTMPVSATGVAAVSPRTSSPSAGPRPGNGSGEADEPLAFTWREHRYVVTRILGHWREEAGWWRRPDGEPIRIEQTDLWRVEATRPDLAGEPRGVYELSHRGQGWRLDRIWD